ncbi:MAG: ChaN family lipoprotein [Elusimicrobia bacterium]|nr:ChaN family lipoprotein [Elusimicrobiota bacterium]
MEGALSLLLAAPLAVGPLKAPAVPAARGVPRSAPQAVVVESPSGAVIGQDALFDRLARADVVFAGEKHDEALHHRVQAALLEGLLARRPRLQLGLEMVSRDLQPTLDAWQDGRMSDADFAAFWKRTWGFDYALYAPVLDYAKSHHVRVLGLNAPIGVIVQVYRGGLSSLTAAQRAELPASVAQTSDPSYLAYLRKTIDETHGHPPPAQLENMLEAQAAWNETMGETAARALADGPLLVLAGTGHMLYRAGVPESLRRRRAAAEAVVLPWPDDGGGAALPDLLRDLRDPARGNLGLADDFWLLPR